MTCSPQRIRRLGELVPLTKHVAYRELVAVDVVRDTALHVGSPRPLFDFSEALQWTWTPTPDGQRFLVARPVATGAVAPRLNVAVNWSSLTNR